MNEGELIRAVREMRRLQKLYFKTRHLSSGRAALIACKEMEAEVDLLLDGEREQAESLFGEPA